MTFNGYLIVDWSLCHLHLSGLERVADSTLPSPWYSFGDVDGDEEKVKTLEREIEYSHTKGLLVKLTHM